MFVRYFIPKNYSIIQRKISSALRLVKKPFFERFSCFLTKGKEIIFPNCSAIIVTDHDIPLSIFHPLGNESAEWSSQIFIPLLPPPSLRQKSVAALE